MKYKFTALKTGLLISLLMGCACCNLRRNTVEQIQIIPADTVKSLFSNHESNDTPVEKKMRDQGAVLPFFPLYTVIFGQIVTFFSKDKKGNDLVTIFCQSLSF